MDNMTDILIKKFIEKVKLESTYNKFLKKDIIYQLISMFNKDYEKLTYTKKIKDPLEFALKFYKHYNNDYYSMIIEGLKNSNIIISQTLKKSFTDLDTNVTYIKLIGDDSDIFILVHELAHYIDRNSTPMIIPSKYDFLGEVFSFYIEKQLEIWLDNDEYKNLINIRRNNRMYYESQMLEAIEYELYCEKIYKEEGQITESSLSIDKVKTVMKYDADGSVVNYLLRYPLANILSTYLMDNNLIQTDNEIYIKCLNINLYEVLNSYSEIKKLK